MKKRRNSDDRLRRLERQAASGNYDDVAAYWLALLRSGKLPRPTFGDIEDIRAWAGWTIELGQAWSSRIWQVNLAPNTYFDELRDEVIYRPGAVVEVYDQLVAGYNLLDMPDNTEVIAFVERRNAIEGVKRELKRLLEKYDDQELREKALKARLKWIKARDEEY